MSTPDNAIRAGDVQFFDNFVPALEADEYTITVTQSAASSDSAHPLDQTFSAIQKFAVIAPRFALPPEDVQSVFPPQNAIGIFDQNLAHVVLNQRVLPWERLIIEGDDSTIGIPWMALLLFTPDQIVPPAGTAPQSALLTNPTLVGSYPVTSSQQSPDSLLTPADPATLGPSVTTLPTDETACKAIDIPTAVFAQVAPLMDELRFLAHVREVGDVLQDKTTDQASGPGWFSVVIGNRFPTAGSSQSMPARYIAHLVSLEGFAAYLVPNPAWPAGKTKVRLASLQSWAFGCIPEAGDFAALASNLAASPIASFQITSGGSGYTSAPDVAITGGGGSGAIAAATVTNGAVTSLSIVEAGSGYTSPPAITFSGGGGTGAAATATLLAQGGDILRLRLPVSGAAQTPGSAAAMAQMALQNGYSALSYDSRVGDSTFGWYHGPFVPNPIEPFSHTQPFASAAAATIYDPNTGTFDLTYAAGWETGRMLALAARSHSTSTMALKKNLRRSINLLRERTRMSAGPGAAAGSDFEAENATTLNAALEKSPSRSFINWMGSDLGKRIPFPGARSIAPVRTHAMAAPLQRTAVAELSSMVQQPGVKALLTLRLTAAVSEPQYSVAVDWLAGLRLLEGVPFSALVPNAAMLPAESIRFFYVDPNYLNALTDGANSIGVQTTLDQANNAALREPLRQAAIARAHTLRSRRIGKPLAKAVATQPADPVAGFLLRSALVSGWPGLEVKAYGSIIAGSNPLSPDQNSLIPLLRMERLAPDVLLCLYPKIPVWIELNEPKEGLAFGVEDSVQAGGDLRVALRYLDNSSGDMGKTTGKDLTFAGSYLRDATTRVVNIGSWQQYLASQVPASTTKWGPAAFAIQMVRAPEQMIFQIQTNPVPPESVVHG
jgi:hypothetical protein